MGAPRPPMAERARSLLETQDAGTLCTLATDPAGWPFGSYTPFSLDAGNRPVIHISRLAEHHRNLSADPRASLLVVESGAGAGAARATILARFAPVAAGDVEAIASTHVARLPQAARVVGFGDFSFFRGEVERVRFIGGFGQIGWVEQADWQAARPDPLALHRQSILSHMNQDHVEALTLYLRVLAGIEAPGAPRMTAIDRLGFEVQCTAGGKEHVERFAWEGEVVTPDEARHALIALVRKARP